MGNTFDDIGRHHALNAEERRTIIENLNKLDERIRGNRVPWLVDLVDAALQSFELAHRPVCFPDNADLSELPAFLRYEGDVRRNLELLLEASRALNNLKVSPQKLAVQPTGHAVSTSDPSKYFDYLIRSLISHDDPFERNELSDVVCAAIEKLAATQLIAARQAASGRPKADNARRNLVRAACYYRSQEFGEESFYWKHLNKAPATSIGSLIVCIEKEFGVKYSSGSIRHFLEEYTHILNQENRLPEQDDFSCFWN